MISWFEIDGKSFIEFLMTSKQLKNYFTIVPLRVPLIVYYISSLFLLIGWGVQIYKKGFRNSFGSLFMYILFVYVIILFCSTCVFRVVSESRNFCLIPFWSYREIMTGSSKYIIENLMNVLVFLPIGFLVPLAYKVYFRGVLLLGLVISLTVELTQMLFKTGLCEFDDVFHNTLGACLGYQLYKFICCTQNGISKLYFHRGK